MGPGKIIGLLDGLKKAAAGLADKAIQLSSGINCLRIVLSDALETPGGMLKALSSVKDGYSLYGSGTSLIWYG